MKNALISLIPNIFDIIFTIPEARFLKKINDKNGKALMAER